MAGEDLNAVYVHETGIKGDRIFAFYDPNSKRHSLPYLTIRENNDMVLMKVKIKEENPEIPYNSDDKPQVEVIFESEKLSIDDDRLLEHFMGRLGRGSQSLTLDYRRAGIHDTKPISLVSIRSIGKLAEERGLGSLDPLRFRSNFYVEWDDKEAFYEEQLVGKSLQIGKVVVLHISKSNVRCTIINVDPQSAEKDNSVLRTVSELHDVKFGIYGEVRSPGSVRVNDTIYLIE